MIIPNICKKKFQTTNQFYSNTLFFKTDLIEKLFEPALVTWALVSVPAWGR